MSLSFRRQSHRLDDLFEKGSDLIASLGGQGVLVRLVHTEGSTYQKAGAHLLLHESGQVYGLVSGGCLEQAILDKAAELMHRSQAELHIFATDAPDELEFGFGMGCGGTLWVLMESVRCDETLARKVRGGDPKARRWAICIQGPDVSSVGQQFEEGQLEAQAFPWNSLGQGLSQLWKHEGYTWALRQKVPELELVIFGAGPGSWPLATMAHTLGWGCQIYDHRPTLLEDVPFPWVERRLLDRAASCLHTHPLASTQVAVLMTHSFAVDLAILSQLRPQDWMYIGVLGSPKRNEALQKALPADIPLRTFPSATYAPAGLNLGGHDPASIALSICAQIQAVLHERSDLMRKPWCLDENSITRGES